STVLPWFPSNRTLVVRSVMNAPCPGGVGPPVGIGVEICECVSDDGPAGERGMKRTKPRAGDLEIRLLGKLEVLRGGEPRVLPASKKSRALLAYLVVTARSHLRERLCDLLWEAPDDPRASLRWSLAKIRPLVDDGEAVRLSGGGDEVSFDPRGAKVDMLEVRAELAGGAAVASLA